MSGLIEAARGFVARYHANERLVAEQRGWSRTIRLVASEGGPPVSIRILDGRVAAVDEAGAAEADIVIAGPDEILRDVLELRRSPNEPYLFGELSVRGSQEDFVRIDYLAVMLCAE